MKFIHHKLLNGYLTVAYNFVSEDEIEYGVAFCCPSDQFNKAKGRLIASNRLSSGKRVGRVTIEDSNSVVQTILKDIEEGRYEIAPYYKYSEMATPLWFFSY